MISLGFALGLLCNVMEKQNFVIEDLLVFLSQYLLVISLCDHREVVSLSLCLLFSDTTNNRAVTHLSIRVLLRCYSCCISPCEHPLISAVSSSALCQPAAGQLLPSPSSSLTSRLFLISWLFIDFAFCL